MGKPQVVLENLVLNNVENLQRVTDSVRRLANYRPIGHIDIKNSPDIISVSNDNSREIKYVLTYSLVRDSRESKEVTLTQRTVNKMIGYKK